MTASKLEVPTSSKADKQSSITRTKKSVKKVNPNNSSGTQGSFSQALPACGIDKEERRQMIAEAAYFRYQNRSNDDYCDVDDWLAAEQEIDRMLDF